MRSATFTTSARQDLPAGLRVTTLAERPDLAVAIPAVLASQWPAFMLDGRPGHDVDLISLVLRAPQHQVLLVDAADEVVAAGISVPLAWDGTTEGLPAGWDGAVGAAADLLDRGAAPSAVCALSITIRPEATGQGLAVHMVQALKQAAAGAGAGTLIVPVRPTGKERYPLVAMSDYAGWRTADGRVFDPWLRVHVKAGAAVLGVAEPSMTITGTVGQWQEWTGLDFPASGPYLVPGGLGPLVVDLDAGTARYQEDNVWVAHPIAG